MLVLEFHATAHARGTGPATLTPPCRYRRRQSSPLRYGGSCQPPWSQIDREREGGYVGMLLRMRGGRRDGSAEGVDARGGRSPGKALCSRGIRMAAVGFFGAG
jgi:hypothetical protein